MDDLRRVVGQFRDLMDELLALLEGGRRLGVAGLVAANTVDKRVVVKMIRDRRHALAHQLGSVQPG